jgi:hypothetical protein
MTKKPTLMSAEQVCRRLRLSRWQLRQRVRRGQIKSCRHESSKFDVAEIVRYERKIKADCERINRERERLGLRPGEPRGKSLSEWNDD